MKKIMPFIFICTLLFSCRQPAQQPSAQQETPKALQEDNSYASGVLSKSRYEGNLLESLYQELAAKDPALKELETAVQALAEGHQDSLRSFQLFDNKNKMYYNVANQYLGNIKDSMLRLKIQTIVIQSLAGYERRTATHNMLGRLIDSAQNDLADIHYALKIVKTLPLIERFQKEKLPATGSAKNLLQAYRETIARMHTGINQ